MLSPACRFAPSHYRLAEHLLQYAERSGVMVAAAITELANRNKPPGIGHIGQRSVNWHKTERWLVS